MNLRRFAAFAFVTSATVLALASCGKSTSPTAATPALDPAPPAAPTNLSSTYVPTVGYDYLYWNASTSPSVKGYEIWESVTQGGTAVKVTVAGASSNYVVLPPVAADCTRYYEVRAGNSTGQFSAFSASIAVDRHVIVSNAGGSPGGGVGGGIHAGE